MSAEYTNGNGRNVWKTLFIALLTSNLTGITGWAIFGLDSVKHAEIDQIMATRAPYIHDKPWIDERFNNIEWRLGKLEK